jgi:hypothetical protein
MSGAAMTKSILTETSLASRQCRSRSQIAAKRSQGGAIFTKHSRTDAGYAGEAVTTTLDPPVAV